MKDTTEDKATEATTVEKSETTADGTQSRVEAYKTTYAITRDPRAAVRAYCAGNKHLIDNAKGCGNW